MQLKHFFMVAILATVSFALQAEIQVKSGETICFLGDSITGYGYRYKGGYVNLVMSGLKTIEKFPTKTIKSILIISILICLMQRNGLAWLRKLA